MSVSGLGLESRRSPRKGLSGETTIAGRLAMVIGAAARGVARRVVKIVVTRVAMTRAMKAAKKVMGATKRANQNVCFVDS
jgi:hypothetical protein